jgi:hypothetical protein
VFRSIRPGLGADGQPALWDAETWTRVAELRGTRLREAEFAPEGETVALTSVDETSVTLWDPTRGARRACGPIGARIRRSRPPLT